MTGTLTESFVVESCEAGPRHSPYSIHKVMIAPLEQDWRRDVSVWGMLFDFHVISGMMSESGFGFATRGEGKGDGWKNSKFFVLSTRFSTLIVSTSLCSIFTSKEKTHFLCLEGRFVSFRCTYWGFYICCFPFI
jgi:hypothetical protein